MPHRSLSPLQHGSLFPLPHCSLSSLPHHGLSPLHGPRYSTLLRLNHSLLLRCNHSPLLCPSHSLLLPSRISLQAMHDEFPRYVSPTSLFISFFSPLFFFFFLFPFCLFTLQDGMLDEMLAFFDTDLASRLPGIPSEGIAEPQEDALFSFSLLEQDVDDEDEIAVALANLAQTPYVFYLFFSFFPSLPACFFFFPPFSFSFFKFFYR
jgi:hypothetical protein